MKCRNRLGFSMVELLVVLGIITVLLALLLPALSRAREHARRVACCSNMRQVSWAFISYAQAHNGWFPAPATVAREQAEDWVYWQPGRDLMESPIFKYLGKSREVLICPSGSPERIPDPGRAVYPFNYSVNARFTGEPGMAPFGRLGSYAEHPCKLSQVVAAAQKILVIDEDVTAVNDGCWHSGDGEYPDGGMTSVSVRHDRGREYGDWRNDSQYLYRGRGNAAFADGHCDFVERRQLVLPVYYNPTRSP